MAETKEITLRQSDVASFIQITSSVPGDTIFNGLKSIYQYGVLMAEGKDEEAKKQAYEHRLDIGDTWRRLKEYEKAQKQLKPIIECIAEAVAMPDIFKWQAGAKKSVKTITNVPELWRKLKEQGTDLDAFLSRCTIDFEDAVLISGMNEPTFLENWGDVANIETKQNKPTLKAL